MSKFPWFFLIQFLNSQKKDLLYFESVQFLFILSALQVFSVDTWLYLHKIFTFQFSLQDLQRKETALRSLGNELKDREDLQEKYDKLKADNKKVSLSLRGFVPYSRGPFLRTRDNNFRSGIFFCSFERRMYLETFLRGGKRIRCGKFFMSKRLTSQGKTLGTRNLTKIQSRYKPKPLIPLESSRKTM